MTSKTISVGGEVGSNGLRFSVSVQWNKIGQAGGAAHRRIYLDSDGRACRVGRTRRQSDGI